MLDIKLIRENPEIIKNDLKKRDDNEKLQWVDQLMKKDKEWRELQYKVQELKKVSRKTWIVSMKIYDKKGCVMRPEVFSIVRHFAT